MQVGSTPPPSQAPSPSPTPLPTTQLTQNRKRKREATADSSPAPDVQAPPPLVTSRDLSKRPVLTISCGPTFHPVPDEADFFKTDLHGVNIRGYRYTPAGISPPGSGSLFRTIECNPTSYRVSWEDRGQQIQVTKDGLGLLGWKGYKSARCNAPVREGKWYMEVKILRGGGARGPRDTGAEGSSVRLGWARREAMLTGPAGQDGYSYAYRDTTGQKVTLARPKQYGKPFKTGDVVGMYISLPPKRQPDPKDPQDPAHIRRDRIAIDLKGQEAFEIKEYAPSKEMEAIMEYAKKSMNTTSVPSATVKKANVPKPEKPAAKRPAPAPLRPLPKLEGSTIAFFLNGEPQGAAFEDIYDYLQLRPADAPARTQRKRAAEGGPKRHKEDICFDDGSLGYYPFISLFNSGSVRMNPGPDFAFLPPPDIDAVVRGRPVEEGQERTWRPICERYPEYMQEQWALDALDEQVGLKEANEVAIEADKRAQRQKKRKESDAKRAAKKARTSGEDPISAPSPLRQSAFPTYEPVEEKMQDVAGWSDHASGEEALGGTLGAPLKAESPILNGIGYGESLSAPSPLRQSVVYDSEMYEPSVFTGASGPNSEYGEEEYGAMNGGSTTLNGPGMANGAGEAMYGAGDTTSTRASSPDPNTPIPHEQ